MEVKYSNNGYDNRITVMRALAIVSVICAHTAPIHGEPDIATNVISLVMRILGAWGVPVFFIISGYLFNKTEDGVIQFIRKRFWGIIIPWLVCYTFLWLYVVLRKGGVTLENWFSFLIGENSSSYFVTMLLAMYVIFWYFRKKYIAILILTMVSALWTVLYPFVYPHGTVLSLVSIIFPFNYLNPLFWIVWFGMGMLLGFQDLFEIALSVCKKTLPLSSILSVAIVVFYVQNGVVYGYFNKYAFLFLILSSMVIIGGAQYITNVGILLFVGECSFPFYLLNQFLAGAVIRISDLINRWWMVALRPFMVLFVLSCFLWLLVKANMRYKIFKPILHIIGYRHFSNNCLK